MKNIRYLGIAAMLAGVVGLVIGIVFIVQSVSVKTMITSELASEKVTLGLPAEGEEGYIAENVVDTAAEAEKAQHILHGHLHDDFGSYGETERDSAERATYITGTTLRNSLNIAVMGFGVVTIALGAGVFMVIIGVALGGTGVGLYRLSGRMS